MVGKSWPATRLLADCRLSPVRRCHLLHAVADGHRDADLEANRIRRLRGIYRERIARVVASPMVRRRSHTSPAFRLSGGGRFLTRECGEVVALCHAHFFIHRVQPVECIGDGFITLLQRRFWKTIGTMKHVLFRRQGEFQSAHCTNHERRGEEIGGPMLTEGEREFNSSLFWLVHCA